VVRNEEAHPTYNREFLARVFESEGEGLYDVRHSALGHLQQGGAPSPFDRLLATRLVYEAITELAKILEKGGRDAVYIGQAGSNIETRPVDRLMDQLDLENKRPYDQWWLSLYPVIPVVSMPRGDVIPVEIPIADAVETTKY
jgi:6-phosphofructokinase 1